MSSFLDDDMTTPDAGVPDSADGEEAAPAAPAEGEASAPAADDGESTDQGGML